MSITFWPHNRDSNFWLVKTPKLFKRINQTSHQATHKSSAASWKYGGKLCACEHCGTWPNWISLLSRACSTSVGSWHPERPACNALTPPSGETHSHASFSVALPMKRNATSRRLQGRRIVRYVLRSQIAALRELAGISRSE